MDRSYRIISNGVGDSGLSSNTITLIGGKVFQTPEPGNEYVDTTGWEFDTIAQVSTTGMLNRLQRNVIQIAQEMKITLDDTTHMLGSTSSLLLVD